MKTSRPSPLLAEFPFPAAADRRRAAEESLEGAPFEKKLITRPPEGLELQPIYPASEGGTNLAVPGVAVKWAVRCW